MTDTITSSKLQALLAKIRKERSIKTQECSSLCAPEESCSIPESGECAVSKSISETEEDSSHILDKYGNIITLNDKQQAFVKLAATEGESAILIGAAGTGKTTCQRAVCTEIIQTSRAGVLDPGNHKHLRHGTPGIVICAYTRRAVANIKRNLSEDLQSNAITIHKLLEYQPVYYEVIDEVSGDSKTKMSFEATRTAYNPLPSSIKTIIFEESSMLGVDLYQQVMDACPHKPQCIFLGDIQQLPPVFGPAILGFKLLELPSIELTEVYRQALESPIISLAHRILSAREIPLSEFKDWKFKDKLTIHPWKKKISAEAALQTAGLFFTKAADSKVYDPDWDIILIPFNKSFGTDELNKIIANHLAHKRGDKVYQVVSGFNKIYLSIGDRILYDKEDAIVMNIVPNPAYSGSSYLPASVTLDYWGHDPEIQAPIDYNESDIDFMLNQVAMNNGEKNEERVRQASHIITLLMSDSDQTLRVDKAADINAMLLGYALTVHKSQGSEWRKVFFLLHQSHATMVQRELLYTAVTRAKEELYIICEPESFEKGITSQRVKGNTLEEKAEYFKGKIEAGFKLKGT